MPSTKFAILTNIYDYFQPYATTFPIFSLEDMVNTMFMLLDHLGIDKVQIIFK